MPHQYVMQRANGNFLTLSGTSLLPIWPDFLTLEKYKLFNPELGLYLPKQIDERMLVKLRALEKQGTKMLLMSTEEHSPDLNDGVQITVDKLEEHARPAA